MQFPLYSQTVVKVGLITWAYVQWQYESNLGAAEFTAYAYYSLWLLNPLIHC